MKRLAVIFCLLLGAWIPHGMVPASIVYVITDYTACNGSGNDEAGFATWLSDALTYQSTHAGQLIQLTVPSGKVCMFTGVGTGASIFAGLKNLVVVGYGATFSDNAGAGNGFFLGGGSLAGVQQNGTDSTARLVTVSAGSTTVTLQDTAKCSLWSSGNRALIAGIDPQGFGAPPNPPIFEYVQVVSTASCAGSGVITLTKPLAFTYKSTWPLYNPGDSGHPDLGGPATFYALDQNWVTTQEYRGLTLSQAGQTLSIGQDITYRDVTVTGVDCLIPTQNNIWRAINVTGTSCVIEADKIVNQVTFVNSRFQSIHFQSASIYNMTMIGGSFSVNLLGTPVRFTGTNCTIANPQVGAQFYGESLTAAFGNCTIGSVTQVGASENSVQTAYSMAGGVLTRPSSDGPVPWAVPGGHYYFQDTGLNQYPFTITDMSSSGGNTVITTSLAGGFPAAGALSIHAADVTVTP